MVDEQVEALVAVVVGEFPLVCADAFEGQIEIEGDGFGFGEGAGGELRMAFAGREDYRIAADVRHGDVVFRGADPHGGLEYRILAAGVLEEVEAIRRDVRGRDDQVVVPVPVEVHRQGLRPKADSEIHHESGIVVADLGQARQRVVLRARTEREDEDYSDEYPRNRLLAACLARMRRGSFCLFSHRMVAPQGAYHVQELDLGSHRHVQQERNGTGACKWRHTSRMKLGTRCWN